MEEHLVRFCRTSKCAQRTLQGVKDVIDARSIIQASRNQSKHLAEGIVSEENVTFENLVPCIRGSVFRCFFTCIDIREPGLRFFQPRRRRHGSEIEGRHDDDFVRLVDNLYVIKSSLMHASFSTSSVNVLMIKKNK